MEAVEYNFGDICLSVHRCDTENELRARLERFERSLIVSDEEWGCNVRLIKARCPGQDWVTGCGLLWHSPISPQIVGHPDPFVVWVMCDFTAFLVNMHEAKIILQRRLPWVFYDTICMKDGSIAVAHELGVQAMDRNGNLLWEISGPDILVGFRVEIGQIVCRFEGGEVLSHELA